MCSLLLPVHVRYLAGGQRRSAVDVPVKVKGGFGYAAAAETDMRQGGFRKCAAAAAADFSLTDTTSAPT